MGDAAIQKKITPWKSMLSSGGEHGGSPSAAAFPGLCVVASLVDKLPNLGGLCRSCEIFGAGELVLPSAAAVAQQELQSVSVTAHRSLASSGRLAEVAPDDLREFVERRRRDGGFCVVAVEQSSSSVPLVRSKSKLFAFELDS